MTDKPIYIYGGSPIDDWVGWQQLTPASFGEDVEGQSAIALAYNSNQDFKTVVDFLQRAQWIARGLMHYDGKDRVGQEAFWISLPMFDAGQSFCVAWKQDNDGVTFIAAPTRLPWLEENCWLMCANGTVRERKAA